MKRVRLAAALLLTSNLSAATFYVTVAGLGGEPEYEQRFSSLALEIDKLEHSGGGPDAKITTLYGGQATKARVTAALAEIAKEAKPSDAVALMLIGHGSFDGFEYKINLPGPDLTGVEIASMLDRIAATRQLVVNMTSSSGGSRAALEKQGRIVITATKSGSEKNATVFARYWVEALRDPAADTDKNEGLTALEAFTYAEQKTNQFYETQKRLATEHAVLEDVGQGDGARKPSSENGEGLVASHFIVLRIGATQLAAATPEKKALLDQREQLEQKIDKLKYEKAAMPSEQYKEQLQALLLELAKTQAELDK
jgi:broad specificity phosphatase PhoE